MSEHTKEPWKGYISRHTDGKDYFAIANANIEPPCNGEVVGIFGELGGILESQTIADVKRVCACVNACAGLSNELLEQPEYSIKSELDSLDEQIAMRLKAEKHIEELNEYIKQLEANLEGYRA